MKTEAIYEVLIHGSHPDEENDDCYDGRDFKTWEEAKALFDNPEALAATFKRDYFDAQYIELTRGTESTYRKNPDYVPSDDDGEWEREGAMQAGMAFGCAGYNDYLGY